MKNEKRHMSHSITSTIHYEAVKLKPCPTLEWIWHCHFNTIKLENRTASGSGSGPDRNGRKSRNWKSESMKWFQQKTKFHLWEVYSVRVVVLSCRCSVTCLLTRLHYTWEKSRERQQCTYLQCLVSGVIRSGEMRNDIKY